MSEERRPYNAADKQQVKEAKKKQKNRRRRQLDDLCAVLSTQEGQRVMWRLLARCGVFKSLEEFSSKIYFKAGQQEVGHFIQGEILEANEEAYFEMMRKPKDEEGLISG